MQHRSRIYTTAIQGRSLPADVVGWGYLVLLASAEALGAWVGTLAGLLAHAVLLLLLLAHALQASAVGAAYQRSLPVLALVPLLRILSLTLPLSNLAPAWSPLVVGLPMLIALILVARRLHLPRIALLGSRADWRWQLIIALSGFCLASLSYWLLTPAPFTNFNGSDLVLGGLSVVVGGAVLEEVLLRGAIQTVYADLVGRWRWLASALLWTVLYFGSHSVPWLVLIGVVGLAFGLIALRTGALWGCLLAHSAWKIGLLLVWPYLVKVAVAERHTALVSGLWSFWLVLGTSLGLWLFDRLRADRQTAHLLLTSYHAPALTDTPPSSTPESQQ